MKMKLNLKLGQKLIITPQLQQAIKLLQLSRLELNQVISQEIIENPMLEEEMTSESPESSDEALSSSSTVDESDEEYRTDKAEIEDLSFIWNEYLDDDRTSYSSAATEDLPSYEQTLSKSDSIFDHLLWQLVLSSVSEEERRIGAVIIGNIDDDGYLRSPLEEIASSAGTKVEDVEDVLKLIQAFDPMGVGARDLKECLLIQVEQLGLNGTLVELIINSHLKDLEGKKYHLIAKALGATIDEVFQAAKVIEGLEPKPGRPFFTTENRIIIPDVYVTRSDKGYTVLLNDDGRPKLRIGSFYKRMLNSQGEIHDPTKTYLEGRLRSALWLIKSIEQRNKTIVRVAESIVKFQQEFFDKGVGFLRPLVLRQVAEDISMHESTISRVTNNKYMHTPQGLFELKYFFSTKINRTGGIGGDLSSITVREMIRKMVAEEDPHRPLKDHEIADRLKIKDIIEIARRTVAKYRTELNIPQASKRKRLF